MSLNKTGLFFSLMSLLLFFSNSTGFDFYAHAVSYYYYNEPINSSYLLFEHIILPRYLFLSVIYEYFASIGFPLGWVVSFLILFPVYKIFSSEVFSGQKSYHGYKIVIIFMVMIFSFFYSGLSLTFLWLMAFHHTRSKIFLLGGLFHPVGFVLFLLYLCFTSRKHLSQFLILVLCPFLFFMFMVSKLQLMSSISYVDFKFYINNETIMDLLFFSLVTKGNEFLQLFLIVTAVFFAGFLRVNYLVRALMYPVFVFLFLRINSYFFKVSYFLTVFSVVFYMSSKPSLLQYLTNFNNNPVYISWFDFGSKDLRDVSHADMYCQRYPDGGC